MENLEKFVRMKIKTLRPLSEKTLGIYFGSFWMVISALSSLSAFSYYSIGVLPLQTQIISSLLPLCLFSTAAYGLFHFRSWAYPVSALAFFTSIVIEVVLFRMFLPASFVAAAVVLYAIHFNREALKGIDQKPEPTSQKSESV